MPVHRQSRRPRSTGAALRPVLAVAAVLLATCSSRSGPASAASDPAQVLYSQGKFVDALPLLEKQAATRKTGTLLYQIGFCRSMTEGVQSESKRKLWAEAAPLLEKEIAQPGGATLDRLYYLTVISSDLRDQDAKRKDEDAMRKDEDAMRRFARQAVDTIEKGPDPNAIPGEDWFRLGRMHDFLQEASEAEAAYRRAVSFFDKKPAANSSYHALALVRVADLDLDGHRYGDAVAGYEAALKIAPTLAQIRPFRQGIAFLGAERLDEAVAAFAKERDPDTATEAQYASDIVRKAKEAGGFDKSDADGTPIDGMSIDGLDPRIKRAAAEFRGAREKNSWKPGDALPAEVALYQKRLVSLLRERLLQTGEVQEFCLKEGIADLVRR